MSATIKSGNNSNVLSVDSDNQILIAPNKNRNKCGLSILSSLPGNSYDTSVTSISSNIAREFDVNDDFGFRVGIDQMLFYENFLGTSLDLGNWSQSTATFTIGVGTGGCALNSSNLTNTACWALISSYKAIPLYGSQTVYVQFQARATGQDQGNKSIEFGLSFTTAGNNPSDGIFFRYGPYGDFRGVINHNGIEFHTDPFPMTVGGSTYQYIMAISQQRVEFFVNGNMVGFINTPTALGSATLSGSLPLYARVVNQGAASTFIGLPPRLVLFEIQVWTSGPYHNRSYQEQVSLMGRHCQSGTSNFSTLGSQSNMTNSLALTSGTLTNTAAPASGYTGTGLGGEFQFAAYAGNNTDNIIFGYQVPATAATAGSSLRSLMVTGIRINTVNTGAVVATTPTVLVWSLAYGSTAISLATGDGAATKAPRRVPIGIQSFLVGDAIGQQRNPINIQFNTPICVYPGQFLHVVAKSPTGLGTATASQVLRGIVMIDGYWEF